MTLREKLAAIDDRGADATLDNPLATFALRIAEAAILSYREAFDVTPIEAAEDVDAYQGRCQAIALREVREAVDTYGIARAYPELVSAGRQLANFFDFEQPLRGGPVNLRELAARLRDALRLADLSVVPNAEG